jgi:transcriptional repressor NrdR
MRCPFCHSDNDKVLDSRSAQAGYRVRRKRICQECGRRFVTMEHIEALNVRVVKSDETREPFDREKIRRGIERACSKRSVPSETIETTVQQIEASIYSEFDFEIPANKIGEVVLRFLADVDEVAYIRFASVYREFSGATDFLRIISVLQKNQSDGGESAWSDNDRVPQGKKTKTPLPESEASEPLVKEKLKKNSRAERAGS